MQGFLEMINAQAKQDWQLQGVFGNYQFAVRQNPVCDDRLLPFFTPTFTRTPGNSIKHFQLREIAFNGIDKTVIETTVLATTDVSILDLDTMYSYMINTAVSSHGFAGTGFYEYYIEDQFGNAFISQVFYVCTLYGSLHVLGDFYPGDFNDDFFKTLN